MEIKNKHVAVALDENGKCEFVAKVKVINDKELNRLLNEQAQHKQKQFNKEYELNQKLSSCQEKVKELQQRDVLLAKSIYDNFVDRGLIENDDNFQQDYYDYIFNNKPIDFSKAPNEYKIILAKVVFKHE